MKPKNRKNKTSQVLPTWFLETSIPRTLLFGHPLAKREIRKHVVGTQPHSSHYVRMEYKRSVVKTLIDIYFVAKEEDTPRDALSTLSQTYQLRTAKIVIDAVNWLAEEPDLLNNKEKFLEKLEMLIIVAIDRFDELIEDRYVDNVTRCPLSNASLKNGYQGFLEEIDCTTQCEVDRLWKNSKAALQRLVDEGETVKNTYIKNTLPLMQATIENPAAPKSKTKCMKAGDFVIALEMPKRFTMLTLDKAFESLCRIIGKNVKVLPSLKVLKEQQEPSHL